MTGRNFSEPVFSLSTQISIDIQDICLLLCEISTHQYQANKELIHAQKNAGPLRKMHIVSHAEEWEVMGNKNFAQIIQIARMMKAFSQNSVKILAKANSPGFNTFSLKMMTSNWSRFVIPKD